MTRLQQELQKHPWTLTRHFNRLSESEQEQVVSRFNRHADACDKAGRPTDPRFLPEFIEDVKKGVKV